MRNWSSRNGESGMIKCKGCIHLPVCTSREEKCQYYETKSDICGEEINKMIGIDMPMPESCDVCPCSALDYEMCKANIEITHLLDNGRPVLECPLIELKLEVDGWTKIVKDIR